MSGIVTTQSGEAEVTVYPYELGIDSDDVSAMYVMDVLGVRVLVRLVRTGDGEHSAIEPKVMIECKGAFTVGVNGDEHEYGGGL